MREQLFRWCHWHLQILQRLCHPGCRDYHRHHLHHLLLRQLPKFRLRLHLRLQIHRHHLRHRSGHMAMFRLLHLLLVLNHRKNPNRRRFLMSRLHLQFHCFLLFR